MMESLRRRFSKSEGGDPWAVGLSLQDESPEASELPSESTVLLAENYAPTSNDVDMKDYYRGLVRTAIQHGGVYRGQEIPIPWLRMTLAGLEMRPIPPEAMWEGVHVTEDSDNLDLGELFPSAKAER
jgi:hypothetical protein